MAETARTTMTITMIIRMAAPRIVLRSVYSVCPMGCGDCEAVGGGVEVGDVTVSVILLLASLFCGMSV